MRLWQFDIDLESRLPIPPPSDARGGRSRRRPSPNGFLRDQVCRQGRAGVRTRQIWLMPAPRADALAEQRFVRLLQIRLTKCEEALCLRHSDCEDSAP